MCATLAGVLGACQQTGSGAGAAPGTGQDRLAQGGDTARGCSEIARVIGSRVLFEYDSAELRPAARGLLEAAAVELQQSPACRFIIEGHCDQRGTREYNLALGEKRAFVVKTYLAALGVDATRMEIVSYGK
jgi:peptidoglycan-associated lipoprotein